MKPSFAQLARLPLNEVDALAPSDLRSLYRSAIDEFWDEQTYDDVLAREADERDRLTELADQWEEGLL